MAKRSRVNNEISMEEKKETKPQVDWRESWGPAFQRVLLSIAAIDKFADAPPKR